MLRRLVSVIAIAVLPIMPTGGFLAQDPTPPAGTPAVAGTPWPTTPEGTSSSNGDAVERTPAAGTPTPTPRPVITSPRTGAKIGGVISVLGTANVAAMHSYSLAFGAANDPLQWIPIGAPRAQAVIEGRLGFWDTTTIPDGVYTLRLRIVRGDDPFEYIDVVVTNLLVSNAPRTPAATPTPAPTSTPTVTPTATPTYTPAPTLDPDDGASPYLYVTQMAQYDPVCPDRPQRYSIWVSNVGMVAVTNVLLVDWLPIGVEPVLEQCTEGAAYSQTDGTLQWEVGDMAPGETRQFEVLVTIPSWYERGKWLSNRVVVRSDQVEHVASTQDSLLSDCVWLKQTAEAQARLLPTLRPSPTGTWTPTPIPASGKPTLLPTLTPLALSLPGEQIERGLDMLTLLVAVGLGVLAVATGILLYRRLVWRG